MTASGSPVDAGFFVGGVERPAKSGATFDVIAPEDGRLVGRAPRCGRDDVNDAVVAARTAFGEWASGAPSVRERALVDAAAAVEANAVRLADLVVDESGSTITKARGEAAYAADLLRAAAGESRRLFGETLPNDRPDRMSLVVREPLGVVAVVSPFNSPLALLTKMLAFPLAAGNALVVKPSEHTPLVAIELARLLSGAGVPDGVVNVVTGFGDDCGQALIAHRDVDGIAFTGSTSTGVHIGRVAMARMRPVQLELGGKNPLMVLSDVDPHDAAAETAVGAFSHAGQICMASTRVIVEAPVADAFCHALVDRAESLHLGDLRDPATAYGPLIDDLAAVKVMAHVEEAVASGATLLTGGRFERERVCAPTVLLEPHRQSNAWREETFGPVVSIVVAEDLDHAVALANDTEYGLSAGVLTNDLRRGLSAARAIRAGSVHVGMHSFQSNALTPIGGYGLSGVGRSGGHWSVEHFTEVKWISVELGTPPRPF